MKKHLNILTLLIVVLISAPLNAADGNEILKRIDAKLMPESYETYRKLINIEPDGKKKEFVFFTVKKGKDKMAMLYISPASEKGRSTLRLGDNMWLYIPNVGKPIRITSLQSITGGVFNNSDIMQVEYSVEYDVEKMEEADKSVILNLKAKNKTVAYDKLKMWATKDDILTKIECYSSSGMLIKTLDFKDIIDFGNGLTRPATIETHSPLYKGYLSVMIYSQVKTRQFDDEIFTVNYMSKLESLRKL
ncbi:MAG: outer membrane lipoprotein-sorting protein [Candidatus Delongbacteria bacterium]|nr:outer membrane lipoprotein-sorting protein [Candidatus Delongbacteria bacterium]MCG2761482.1 outer membrane lipoprotein-sorting protein [Candidatus Delongbacteria bacterium]